VDVFKEKKSNKKRKLIYAVGMISAIAAYFTLASVASDLSPQIEQNKVQVANVEYGALKVKVSAFGSIKSKSINIISNDVDGIITEVFVQGGDYVKQGQIILKLTNLELSNIVDELSWGLEELEFQHKELLLKNKALLIKEELTLFETKMQFDISQLNLEAQEKLIKKYNVVSKIDYEETKLNNIMLQRQYQLSQAKFEHLRQQVEATREAQLAKINKNRKILARSQKQVEDLIVKARFSGYLDQLNLEVGQQLSKGEKVARVIGKKGFYAELNVPEYNVSAVKIGQEAIISIRGDFFEGEVTRISPSVAEGSVKVNVSIHQTKAAPPKLDQSVKGQIITTNIASTYFVKKPIYAMENTTTMAFVNSNSGVMFRRSSVSFGQVSDEYIEIRSGVKENDNILISDITEYSSHEQIEIN
jgi:multidrug resistance efflux pump